MFQLKFCLKIFETCSLLYVSVLKCSILAIILFEYLLLDPNAGGGQSVQWARGPLTSRTYGLSLGVKFIQQCFKRQ